MSGPAADDEVVLVGEVETDGGHRAPAGTPALVLEVLPDGALLLEVRLPDPALVGDVRFDTCAVHADRVRLA